MGGVEWSVKHRSVLHGLNIILYLVSRHRDLYRPVKAFFLSFENIQLGFFTLVLPAWTISLFLCHPQARSGLPALHSIHQEGFPLTWGTKFGSSATSSCSWSPCREQLPLICSHFHTYTGARVYTSMLVDSLQKCLGNHPFYPRTCTLPLHSHRLRGINRVG